ncbi:MAG: hypothetical protein IJY90_00655 [Clostridia bacterium]|nr:hypothetical protein [Clostridia bacterium]
MSEQKEEKRSKKKKLIIIIIFCLLALLIGAGVGVFFVLNKPESDFEVEYQVDVSCTITGKLRYANGGIEAVPEPIVFRADDENQSPQQSLDFGQGYRFSSGTEILTFTYTFTNDDTRQMNVSLVDETIKDNIMVTYLVKQGHLETNLNPAAGFIVDPGDTWTVECYVSILNPNNNARYTSSDDNSFTWVIVGID